MSEEEIKVMDASLSQSSEIYAYSMHRKEMFFKKGRAVLDIETYVDNSEERSTYYNMVPFCVSLVGDLQ